MRKNEAVWLEKYGRWQIKVQVDGVRKTFYSSQKGKKGKIEAEQKADKFINAGVITSETRLLKAYNGFLEYTELHTGKKNVNNHKSIFGTWILPDLQHRKVNTISTADWQGCIDKAFRKGRAKKTLQNIRGSITAFLSYCEDAGIEFKQLRKLKINNTAYVKGVNILQPEQLRALLALTPQDNGYAYYFQFLALTGLRPSEMLRLKEKDVRGGILAVEKSKTEAGKRAFYLNDYAADVLNKQKQLKKEKSVLSPLLFPSWRTKQECKIAKLYKQWLKVRDIIGTDCTMYALRHTFVSIGRQTVPEEFMKLLVGHTQNMTTYGTYGHELNGDRKQAATLMQISFDNVLKK